MILQYFILMLGSISVSCSKDNPELPLEKAVYRDFQSIAAFEKTWDSLSVIADSVVRKNQMGELWDSLKINNQLPFAIHDSVVFMYKGKSEPYWAGDFNGWGSETTGWKGKKIGNSDFWWLKKQFPPDARLDYKVVVGNSWILDPSNPQIQYSGWGPNSQLTMPEWIFPAETELHQGVISGSLSEIQQIQSNSTNLGYKVNYRVYLPYNYASTDRMPVIYVTDGHEYADAKLGAMTIILDNLIYEGIIDPVVAVFVDPRNPTNGENRRMDEYRANIRFVNFLADELVNKIDENYKTLQSSHERAILGTSLGGWNAAYTGFHRSDKFGLIGIHSPAFDNAILNSFEKSEKLDLKLFMSTGTIYDTQLKAASMRDILQAKGYDLNYIEVNQGHSWGNWRGLTDAALIWFFSRNP